MLSDEEKQSIESLKNIAIYIGDNYTFSQQGIRNLRENLRIVLSAIEKQSKEIEEYKKQLDLDNECEIALNSKVMDLEKEIEEAEQKERKAYIKGTNDADELCNKKWEDKIKAKIEEVDIQLQKLKDGLTGRKTNFVNKNMLFAQKEVLQSLLEKE